MSAENPNEFKATRRSELTRTLTGHPNNTGFPATRRGELPAALVPPGQVVSATSEPIVLSEVLALTAASQHTETGTLADALVLDAVLTTSESVTAGESTAIEVAGVTNISDTDALTSTETASIAATLSDSDSLSLAEDAALALSDSDTGTVTEDPSLTQTIVASDDLSSLELASLEVILVASDDLTATEIGVVGEELTDTDAETFWETPTPLRALRAWSDETPFRIEFALPHNLVTGQEVLIDSTGDYLDGSWIVTVVDATNITIDLSLLIIGPLLIIVTPVLPMIGVEDLSESASLSDSTDVAALISDSATLTEDAVVSVSIDDSETETYWDHPSPRVYLRGYNGAPYQLEFALPHNLTTGQEVLIESTPDYLDGSWIVTVIDPTNITLDGSSLFLGGPLPFQVILTPVIPMIGVEDSELVGSTEDGVVVVGASTPTATDDVTLTEAVALAVALTDSGVGRDSFNASFAATETISFSEVVVLTVLAADSATSTVTEPLPQQAVSDRFVLTELGQIATLASPDYDSFLFRELAVVTSDLVLTLTGSFRLNGVLLDPQPNELAWLANPELGSYVSGKPLRSGRGRVMLSWEVLSYAQMSVLLSLWDPASPRVTLTLPSPRSNQIVTYQATMARPIFQSRETFYFRQVAIEFSWLTPQGATWPQPVGSYP